MKQTIRWKLIGTTVLVATFGTLVARIIWVLFFETAPASTTPSICIEMHSDGTVEYCPHPMAN